MSGTSKNREAKIVDDISDSLLGETQTAFPLAPSPPRDNASIGALFRALLDNEVPPQIPADNDSPWAEELAAVAGARRAGGREGARRAFQALAARNHHLATLVAGLSSSPRFLSWSQISEMKFLEPAWIIPGLLPAGLTFLAGRPKIGKSWLALQIAGAVATGKQVLGVSVEAGPVLYLALEDSLRRVAQRGRLQGLPYSAPVVFATAWEPLAKGGLTALQTAIEDRRPRLVVIDTFSRIAGDADQQNVSEMTKMLAGLQQVALNHGVALLCVDHHRKPFGMQTNVIDDLLGSTAKGAVTDAVWGLYRKQGEHTATLKITGRDLDERDLILTFNGTTMCWHYEGRVGEVRRHTLQDKILETIRALNTTGELATTTRIASYLSQDKGNVSRALADLLARGAVVKAPRQGKQQPYILPDNDMDNTQQ